MVHEEELQMVHAASSIQVLVSNHLRALDKKGEAGKSTRCKPPEGFVTVNVDAAFDCADGRGATG